VISVRSGVPILPLAARLPQGARPQAPGPARRSCGADPAPG